MITILGATGYTGRLIARQLAAMDLPGGLLLAGRSAEKLAALSASLPGQPDWRVADARKPDSLIAVCQASQVLVNCAGPFTDYGEAVVAKAVQHGVHYLDITNELGYVYRLLGYDHLARQAGAAVVPGCAFEVALADCAAAMLAAAVDFKIEHVNVVYALAGGGSSLGTRRSAIRTLGTSWLNYAGGAWGTAVPCRRSRLVKLPAGERAALSIPSSEIVTLPRHLDIQSVDTWLVISRRRRRWATFAVPWFARLARTPFGPAISALSGLVSPPKEDGIRSDVPFMVVVEVVGEGVQRQAVITGKGVYEVTAKIAAYAAARFSQPDFKQAGVLPPSACLPPDKFFMMLEEQAGVMLGVLDAAL